MEIRIIIKVKGGVRTPVEVSASTNSVNEKRLKFANGYETSDLIIAKWLVENLGNSLHALQNQEEPCEIFK